VEAGFDGVSLANNHIWDWGVSALLDTASSLKSAGITPVGAGANEDQANGPLIAAAGQAKIALVAYTPFFPKELEAQPQSPGVSHFDKAKMLETVSYLRRIADAVVVSLHWGEEYQMSADDEQKNLARDLIDAGADIIIGHHPHVRQEVEHYKNGYIAYSLGNFVSGINPNEEALRGYAVKVIMKGRRIANIQALDVLNSGSEMQPEIIGN
jgi:poly-gamma-glutamate synthesis protein (capsule biosynthesis protein)